MHLEVIFQLLMCGINADTTHVVFTSGLEVEFHPNLTPKPQNPLERIREVWKIRFVLIS